MIGRRVDIGMVTFNTRDLSIEALGRTVDLLAGVDHRILVHDNASSDGSASAIADAVPTAEVVAGDTNLGFAGGMNRLIERSDAPWFFALNSDAWVQPGAIERLLGAGEASPSTALVVPRLERPDGTLEHSTFPFPSVRVAAITALGGYRRLWPDLARELALVGAWEHDVAREVDWAIGAAWLMRRDAIDDVGGFDESFFMYAEDLEWCERAAGRGWDVRFEPAARVVHVGNASGAAAFGADRTRTHVTNSDLLYRRTHGRVDTALYRTLTIAGYARLYALARMRGDQRGRAEWAAHVRAHLSTMRA